MIEVPLINSSHDLLPAKLQAVTFYVFRIQMLSSDFLVCAKDSHTGRSVGCPMLRKQLTSMILPFRQVQTTAGFKLVGATTFIFFVSRGSHINIERGRGCRGALRVSRAHRVSDTRDKLSQDVSVKRLST